MVDSIADVVERMLAEGVSHETIVATVRAMEGVTLRYVTERYGNAGVTREKTRLRVQNYRNRKKSQQVAKANDVATQSVTVTAQSVNGNVTSHCVPNDSFFLEDKKERKKEVVARARGTRLTAGTPITNEFRNIAVELGLPANQIDRRWAEFVDYWCALPGSRGSKLDWPATWRNRLRQISPPAPAKVFDIRSHLV